ncbi:MAG: hypothetical protein ACI9QA_000236 [Methanobacteriota archaeon]|jgi:hypothetical protein
MMDAETVRDAVRRRLAVDTRAVAVFRVTLGLSLLADLSMRARGLGVFYTDAGVLPRDVLAQLFPSLARLSLHGLSGAVWVQIVLVSVSAVSALALLVGLRSRTAASVALVLHVSMYARNPFVLNGGDTMLAVLLLLSVFTPLGARWSVDAVGRDDEAPGSVLSAPTVAPLLFILVIYSSNAVLRYRGEPWMSGEAVRRVFGLETVTVLAGPYLAQFPFVLEAVNWVWVAMLTVSFLLVALTGWLRAAFALSFIVAHTVMALTLRLGVFPVVVISALVLFLPPVFWDRVEKQLPSDGVASLPPRRLHAVSRVRTVTSGSLLRVRAGTVVAVTVVSAVLFWQGAALGYVDAPDAGGVDPGEYAWKMYSPTPEGTYGWYTASVEPADGDGTYVFPDTVAETDGSVRYAPRRTADAYPSTLWYRYLNGIDDASEMRQHAFADSLCRSSRKGHGDADVEVWHTEREVVLNGADEERSYRVVRHDCG